MCPGGDINFLLNGDGARAGAPAASDRFTKQTETWVGTLNSNQEPQGKLKAPAAAAAGCLLSSRTPQRRSWVLIYPAVALRTPFPLPLKGDVCALTVGTALRWNTWRSEKPVAVSMCRVQFFQIPNNYYSIDRDYKG